jgi:hypothetical protein
MSTTYLLRIQLGLNVFPLFPFQFKAQGNYQISIICYKVILKLSRQQ